MFVVKSTVKLGKPPLIINLDDESNVSESDIEILTIEDSWCSANQSSELTNVESVSTSSDDPTETRKQSETAGGLCVNIPKNLETRLPEGDHLSLDTVCPLAVQCFSGHLSKTKLTSEGGIERTQLNDKVPHIGHGTIASEIQSDIMRQPLKYAKNNPKPRSTDCSSYDPSLCRITVENASDTKCRKANGTALLQKLPSDRNSEEENSDEGIAKKTRNKGRKRKFDMAGIVNSDTEHPSKEVKLLRRRVNGTALLQKLPNDKNCEKEKSNEGVAKKPRRKGPKQKAGMADIVNSDTEQPSKEVKLLRRRTNGTALLQQLSNDRNCGDEQSNKGMAKKVRKNNQTPKANMTGIVNGDKAHPSKASIKCPEKLNSGNRARQLNDKQTASILTKAKAITQRKKSQPNYRTKLLSSKKLNFGNGANELYNTLTASILAKPKVKAKTKRKKRKHSQASPKTNEGEPIAAVDSPAVQVYLLSSTNEFQHQLADDSSNTPVQDTFIEDQNAPLGSSINPILIPDITFVQENEDELLASNENASSENQEQTIVSSPEIELLCMAAPSNSSFKEVKSIMDTSSGKNLCENSKKNVPCSDLELAYEKISSVEHVTQLSLISKQPHQPTSSLQGQPRSGHVQVSNFLYGAQPAGHCLAQPSPPVLSTFTSVNNAFEIRRTIFNGVISNNMPPSSLKGSSLQCFATSQNALNVAPALVPTANASNIWIGMPLQAPPAHVLKWKNLLAEQAELRRRSSINTASSGFPVPNNLRPVAIDGSNVAFSHGKDKVFSTRGIKLCIDYFLKRGHTVKAFVPQFRRKAGYSVQDQPLLEMLGKSQHVVFTPSRDINGINVACYDDRFVLEYAARSGAVIVSNDNYRDLMKENAFWKEIINTRLLMYSFADDHFLVPEDPLGRHGPRLDQFLRF